MDDRRARPIDPSRAAATPAAGVDTLDAVTERHADRPISTGAFL